MNQVVPWAALVALIHDMPEARIRRWAVLRIHGLQLWWNLSDPAMEEELHERRL